MQATSAIPGTTGGNREFLRDDITVLEPEKTPYTSMVAKTNEAAAMLVETVSNRYRAPRTSGSREGTAGGKGNNKAVKRARFGNYMHRAQDEWAATREQVLLSQRGGVAGVRNEADWQRAQTLAEFKRDLEAVNCSNNEAQNGAGGDADMKTRGCFKWLTPASGSYGGGALSPDVDANFRVPGSASLGDAPDASGSVSCVYAHNVAAPQLFTEDNFNKLGKNLQKIHGGKETFEMIAGDNVVETVDHFSRIVASSTSTAYTVPHYGGETTISMMVNIYESSFWRVNVIPTQWNQVNTAGAGDPNAALIMHMDLWYLDFLQNLDEVESYENAGGEGGTFLAEWVNMCLSPRGNAKIIQT
jgi:hypothetical protein